MGSVTANDQQCVTERGHDNCRCIYIVCVCGCVCGCACVSGGKGLRTENGGSTPPYTVLRKIYPIFHAHPRLLECIHAHACVFGLDIILHTCNMNPRS